MATVDEQIDKALAELNAPPLAIRELPEDEAWNIYHEAMHKFVDDNPRVWWLSLKKKPVSIDVDDSAEFHYLRQHWPKEDTRCYFVPENESDTPRVFDVTLEGIIQILGNASFFEYNLVGKRLDWIMIENDHNELLIIR